MWELFRVKVYDITDVNVCEDVLVLSPDVVAAYQDIRRIYDLLNDDNYSYGIMLLETPVEYSILAEYPMSTKLLLHNGCFESLGESLCRYCEHMSSYLRK